MREGVVVWRRGFCRGGWGVRGMLLCRVVCVVLLCVVSTFRCCVPTVVFVCFYIPLGASRQNTYPAPWKNEPPVVTVYLRRLRMEREGRERERAREGSSTQESKKWHTLRL